MRMPFYIPFPYIPLLLLGHLPRPLRRRPRQDLTNAPPNKLGTLRGIDRSPKSFILIIIHYGVGLGVIGRETGLEGFRVVVGTLDQGLARFVVRHRLFGRIDYAGRQ